MTESTSDVIMRLFAEAFEVGPADDDLRSALNTAFPNDAQKTDYMLSEEGQRFATLAYRKARTAASLGDALNEGDISEENEVADTRNRIAAALSDIDLLQSFICDECNRAVSDPLNNIVPEFYTDGDFRVGYRIFEETFDEMPPDETLN